MNLLKDSEGFGGLSSVGKMEWLKDIENILSAGFGWLTGQGYLGYTRAGEETTITTSDERTLSGVVNSDGTFTV
jgi:hypothetical protein